MGCPNQCVFCNQKTISGVHEFDSASLKNIINGYFQTVYDDCDAEIAFFGGSFTGIDRHLMISLLKIAYEYVKLGLVKSIRCSTRPDYINTDVLDILQEYGVKSIELGLQSTDPGVLSLCKRGHTYQDEIDACRMIVDRGFVLSGQMMIGLPGSTLESEIKTAEFIVNSGAKEARIYPTVVFHDTELFEMVRSGIYFPLELEDAVFRSAEVLKILAGADVKLLRIGLCDSENLHSEKTYYAGPNHSALGELVENKLYCDLIKFKLETLGDVNGATCVVTVPKGHTSKIIGQNKRNKDLLKENFGLLDLKVRETDALTGYNILLDIQERK